MEECGRAFNVRVWHCHLCVLYTDVDNLFVGNVLIFLLHTQVPHIDLIILLPIFLAKKTTKTERE